MNLRATAMLLSTLGTSTLFATPAGAGWYGGAALGRAEVDETAGAVEVDDDDTAWRLFAGYSLVPQLAFELGYTDLGEFSGQAGPTPFEIEISGFTFHGVVSVPFAERFAVFGKVGYFLWDQETSIDDASFDSDGFDFVGGLGLEYRFTDTTAAQLSWERYDSDADVEFVGAALVYRF